MTDNANAKTPRLKGKGWFVERGVIYVNGTVEGFGFKRKSTRMEATPNNIKYVNKNARELLVQLLNKDKFVVSSDFATFGWGVVEKGVKRKGKKGGRGELDQKAAISKFDRLILPYFKRYKIEEIKASHVELWQESLLKQGLSTSTVSKCRNLLGQIMHKACADDLVTKNPVEYAEKIEVKHEKQFGYSVDEAILIMREADGWLKVFLTIAFTTGMRTGEIMALKWEDVRTDLSCILLKRSVTKGILTEGSSGTKNHERIVPIVSEVMNMIEELKTKSSSEWMFPAKHGRFFAESKGIVKYHFKPLLKRIGVKYRTLRVTRHTLSTIASNLMVGTEAVSSMVGNSEEVRDAHYVDFAVTKERVDAVRTEFAPVNNVFFPKEKVEVK